MTTPVDPRIAIRQRSEAELLDYEHRRARAGYPATFPYVPTGRPREFRAAARDCRGSRQRCPACGAYEFKYVKSRHALVCQCGAVALLDGRW